ncbi:ribosome small subunit-dependent GTPase A [Aquisalimonas lutea]|uniref:ribosome small subunit-dependent GTPase A n=1 Tax=Aquisalimonas lutea TaxID=1327750 RepID=UPI0025B46371|nr:ribosome small subunit-dependent GTPase A [Aquisalimonas lutea]MDN3518334.1 ribosome small subunit-dependent GTPase A [Aquisalimonas lutea]
MDQGRVLVTYGTESVVETADGTLVRCLTRRRTGRPVCGDRVDWSGRPPGECVIQAIHPRRNTLIRTDYRGHEKPLAANLDQLLFMCAPEPAPDARLMDRYLVLAESLGITPLIAVNKQDLAADPALAMPGMVTDAASRHGFAVHAVSAASGQGLEALAQALTGMTTLLAGQSGVGKSSLINALVPDRHVRTQEISATSGQGRHTTTATTLYSLPDGGAIVDAPGVRTLRLGHLSRASIQQGFPEIAALAAHCTYRDCEHGDEPGCAVRSAAAEQRISATRLRNFRELLAERS